MKPYHKIDSIWKRDQATGLIQVGAYSNDEFEYLAECDWEWTEKIDGTNIRCIRAEGRWEFRGKTDEASIPAPLVEWLRQHFEKWLPPVTGNDELTLYGEGFGWKIQKVGPRYQKEPGFILFDVNVGKWWLRRVDVEHIAARYSLAIAPIVGIGTLLQACEYVQGERRSIVAQDTTLEAEGLVLRPLLRLQGEMGQRIITKIKASDYAKLKRQEAVMDPKQHECALCGSPKGLPWTYICRECCKKIAEENGGAPIAPTYPR